MKNIKSGIINFFNLKLDLIKFLFKQKRLIIPLLFVLSYVLLYFLVDTSSQSLIAHDEGLYARRSRLLAESNNWFSPPFVDPHHKTLGSYWFIALSIRLFGFSELSLRLPSILSSFFCLIITYLIALKITNKRSALLSIFALSSMPLWIQYSRYASPDLPFLSCILLVVLFFLKFLDTTIYSNKYLYIFCSGFFISIAFFIRSYMVIVPLLGLTPFLLFHLTRSENIFKIIFASAIFVGLIPTFLNLYFSYSFFGLKSILVLFDFAKKQAIGSSHFNNILLIPLNYFYYTFPIGVLFIILFVFTRSKNHIKYPLLIYCFPLISLFLLLSMSTSYQHYYLFLLPFLSIIFSIQLDSYYFRSSTSKAIIKNILLILLLIMSSIIILFVYLFKNHYSIEESFPSSLVYILSFVLFISYISSIRYLVDSRFFQFNLKSLFFNIILPQYVCISLLFNLGVLGNPNYKIKAFLNEGLVTSVINDNTIYLYNVDNKIKTLLSYYLPSSEIVYSVNDIGAFKYVITSDSDFLNSIATRSSFKKIKNFDNHFLLLNMAK